MSDFTNIKDEILNLRKILLDAQKAYYIDAMPLMSDIEYDGLFDKLLKLEKENPQFYDPNSPTVRVGSDIDNTLPEYEHSVPILSLDKCYKIEDLMDWIDKTSKKIDNKIEVIIEPKIDGAGVVLYYNEGKLYRVLTRGNGFKGNDITENIKTIKSVPLIIENKEKFAVRGEVYIRNDEFIEFNKRYADGSYANPRNLASGSIRRLKSKETALFPLKIFIYEGYFENNIINYHSEMLIALKELGFPLNEYVGFFSNINDAYKLPFKESTNGTLDKIPEYINKLQTQRKSFPYDIDGLVVKINNLNDREKLGYTQHHPRWAIAYKFDAPLAETVVESIIVQIGRGGRATPVANLKPVSLAGSLISRATLHNQDYINSINVNEGDKVTISKRGDVIPAVEEVIEKGENILPYKINKECPICRSNFVKDGAHLFCPNEECPGRLLGTLQYFVSRSQMDIESLGDKTIEFLFDKGFIRYIPDIYEFDYNRLIDFEGFKEKKIKNIIDSVEESKKRDFKTVLSSLGLKDIGNKASEILVDKFNNIDNIISIVKKNNIEELINIDGIGEGIAKSIINHFTNLKILKIIDRLKKNGLKFFKENVDALDENEKFLKETKWVITGSFENFKPRDKAGDLIKKYGGEVLTSISSNTTHLLCGESPGSKLDKARSLNIKIINEYEFLNIINEKKI